MAWIAGTTGLYNPKVAPVVHYISEKEMSIMYCHKVEAKCMLGGLYIWGSNTVYVNKDQSHAGRQVVLVHELTHYMQARNHQYYSGTCESNMKRELDAYVVEKKYAQMYYPKIGHRVKVPPEINLDLCHKKQ